MCGKFKVSIRQNTDTQIDTYLPYNLTFNNNGCRANIIPKHSIIYAVKNDIGTEKLWRRNICKQTINMIEAKFNCTDFKEFVIVEYTCVVCWFAD